MIWNQFAHLESKKYDCGYCGESLASEKGYFAIRAPSDPTKVGAVYICHFCSKPTFFNLETKEQYPGPAYGTTVTGIDDESVKLMYEEARNCIKTNSYSASVLCCRKLLMHIAVSKGAEQNLSFLEYVEFLSENHFIPPGAKDWVDHIREKGNEANHEILIMKKEDAERLITFCGILLKMIFEFPSTVPKKMPKA